MSTNGCTGHLEKGEPLAGHWSGEGLPYP